MKIKDLMSKNVKTLNPEDSIAYATELMLEARVRHLPVVRGPKVIGVLSERDILRRGSELAGGRAAAPDMVSNAMSQAPLVVGPEDPITAALTLMLDHHVGSIPVVTPEGPVGIITMTDILRHDLEHASRRAKPQ